MSTSTSSPVDVPRRRLRLLGAGLLAVGLAAVAVVTSSAEEPAPPSAVDDTQDTAPDGDAGTEEAAGQDVEPAAPGDEVAPADAPEAEPATIGALGHEVDADRDLVSFWDTPPALADLDGWLQADAYGTAVDSLDDVVGQPATIVQFWTFGCRNCVATLPHLRAIEEHYRDDGLRVVGVHAAEFAFEEEPAAIQEAARDLGVTWPIALDTRRTNFRAWQPDGGNFWPRTYVLDAEGRIVYDEIGEGGYERLEDTVATLVAGGATTPRGDGSSAVTGGR